MNQVKFIKGCLPQILLGPFLNALTHVLQRIIEVVVLCADQGTVLCVHRGKENYQNETRQRPRNQGNFIAIMNSIAKHNKL